MNSSMTSVMESAVVISAQPRATLWATALFCFNPSPQAGLAKEVSTLRANHAYNIAKIIHAYHATASRERTELCYRDKLGFPGPLILGFPNLFELIDDSWCCWRVL
ncbi:hypothetical protein BpHYR1_001317 [Brachionus plicatilis]|uniref:Uncharacterized protein n=1 Tax=Brachionus plicatilis TaxID=10195 RepID=A0A3M7T7K2_BRAPC|nr:hypothetical protein BpHYR1_001317 [Brachionus plicatilis]